MKLHNDYLYLALNDCVMRYRLGDGKLEPSGKEETVVSGLPREGAHQAKSLGIRSRRGDVRERRLRDEQLSED